MFNCNNSFSKYFSNSTSFLIFFGLFHFFIISCSKKIQPEKPSENYVNNEFQPEISNITIPIEIEIAKLNTIVNKNINGLLYEDNDLNNNNGDNLLFKVFKYSDILIEIKEDYIYYTVPLKIWLKAGFEKEKFGVNISHFEETNFVVSIDFKSKINIDNNYKLNTHTEVLGYKWIQKPTLKFGIVEIPLNSLVDVMMKSQKENIGPMIDQQLKSAINIKKYIQDTWQSIQNPIGLPSEIKTFLKINPQEISISPLHSEKGKLKTSIGIKAITEIFITDKSPSKTNQPLPALKNIKGNSNDIAINVITDLPYDEIKKLTLPSLTQQTFTFNNGKKTVKINEMEVYGSNGKMIVKLNLIGSLKGEVFLSGVPKYDTTNQIVFFDEMDYDIKTKNILAKSANWLAHDKFVKIMQPYFKYSLAKQLKDIKASAQKTLSNYKITNGIFFNGKINDFNLNNIFLTQQSLKCNFKIKGNATVKIDDL
jgi:hypothetical protein